MLYRMNTLELFSQLRKLAEERRDKTIDAARAQYSQSIQDIAAIEHSLAPPMKVERPITVRNDVDFGMLVKQYAASQTETRYSPAQIISADKEAVWGDPDKDKICTSHIERMNLTVRMQMRRFTRLTNAHSKSLDHHKAMQNVFFAWYNFCKKHSSLKGMTPAMASGLTESPLGLSQILA